MKMIYRFYRFAIGENDDRTWDIGLVDEHGSFFPTQHGFQSFAAAHDELIQNGPWKVDEAQIARDVIKQLGEALRTNRIK